MIDIRPFSSLGAFRNDWLNAKHHFSFGHYRDPKRMGFGALRVWNDDEVQPGTGFDPHPHQNMEIITFVRQGAITHKDSLGNEGATRAGDVQVMHAGTGITHAEYNFEDKATRLFQIWIVPDEMGVKPGWGAKEFPRATGDGLQVLASGRGAAALRQRRGAGGQAAAGRGGHLYAETGPRGVPGTGGGRYQSQRQAGA